MNFAALLKETINSVQERTETDADDDRIDDELQNILSHPAPSYSDRSYWDLRYEREPEPLDWYQTWETLKPVIGKYIPKDSVVLSVGCGNSPMSEEIAKDGAKEVCNIDFSHIVIEQMKEQHADNEKLKFEEGDVTKMPYSDGYFDVVFDKGTLDCFISSCEEEARVPTMLSEILRVLKPGGIFLEISYGTPNTRAPFLKNSALSWTLSDTKEVEELNEPGTFHYVYIVKKNE